MDKLISTRTALTIVCLLFTTILYAKDYNITEYGAKSDTTILSTKAIQAAIDQCAVHGGVVIVPAGNYSSGTFFFKSNVTLHIEKGATLYGSKHLKDYPEILPDYTFYRKGIFKRSLIYAENCDNIAIEGEGTIHGQGEFFRAPKGPEENTYSIRPTLIWMIKCTNVRTEGVRLRNSALWMQHYLACNQVYIHNIDVFNHCNKNNDMIDIDGCSDVRISDCVGDTDDDGLTLKSTSGRATENVVITNCLLSSHCNALKMGTESNSGFKNIAISNIVIKPSIVSDKVISGYREGISGISLEMVDGGVLDGVVISNVRIDGSNCPLFIRLGNRARPYFEGQKIGQVGLLQNISISNVIAANAKKTGCSITGIPGYPVGNISLSHIFIEFEGGGTKEDFMREIPEKEKSYPEAFMFDVLPSYGFFIRHAQNIRFTDVQLKTKIEDKRPALYLIDVKNSDFAGLHMTSSSNNYCNICLDNTEDIRISECQIEGYSNSFLNLKGSRNLKTTLVNNNLTNTKTLFTPGNIIKNPIHEYGTIK